MSITRDFMVVTRIAMPSTVNVTVLDAETAKPPANAEYQQQPSDYEPQHQRRGLMKFCSIQSTRFYPDLSNHFNDLFSSK